MSHFLTTLHSPEEFGVNRKVTMQTKKPPKKKVSDEQLLSDAKKALKKTRRVLEAELKEVDRYIKALDGYSSFCL